MTRNLKSWAGSADLSDLKDPGTSLQASGYAGLQKLPASEFNFILRQLFRRMPSFTSAADAHEALEDGDTCIVDEFDPSVEPMSKTWSYINASASGMVDIAADGLFVYVCDDVGDVVYCLDRDTGEVIDTLSVNAPQAVHSDGEFVFIAEATNDTVLKYPQPTRESGWAAAAAGYTPTTFGANPTDVYSNGEAVWVTHLITGGSCVAKINRDTGALLYQSLAHGGANLRCVVATHNRVFVGGSADIGVTIRQIDFEGVGSSLDTAAGFSASCKDLALVDCVTHDGTDAKRVVLVAVGQDASSSDVIAYDKNLNVVWESSIMAGHDLSAVCWDGEHIWAAGDVDSGRSMVMLDPATGEIMQSFNHATADPAALASDGFGVFAAGSKDSGDDSLAWRHHVILAPAFATKMVGTEPYRYPWHIGLVKMSRYLGVL